MEQFYLSICSKTVEPLAKVPCTCCSRLSGLHAPDGGAGRAPRKLHDTDHSGKLHSPSVI
jgi:hypothetical protein